MDEDQDTPKTTAGISTSQWVMIGTLGALSALAVILAFAARRMQSPTDTTLIVPPGNEPWQESMRHFARAIDYRFAGIEEKLAVHDRVLGIPQPAPPAPVDRTFRPTPEPIFDAPPNNDGSVSMSHVPVGATDPPPPGPAAVSLPPDVSPE